MKYESNDPQALKELWEIKEEAYCEVAGLPTLKEKIHKRIQNSSVAAKRAKKIHSHWY